ncbi:ATP-binding protein [Sesbania bispinosa]|nr:ATP-binding protein [Sesbania bispinosa]
MSPKLDKSSMAKRIAEKKKEAARVKDEAPVSGAAKSTDKLEKAESSDAGKETQPSSKGVPKKRRKGNTTQEINDISDDENQVLMGFTF